MVWTLLALAVCLNAQIAHASAGGTSYPGDPADIEVVGMTAPSKVATLASVLAARIAQILAPEGGIVQEGDVVVVLDEGDQSARTEMAKVAAESTLDIDLARIQMEHAQREWNRLVRLHGDDYASSKELSDAYARAEAARLEYELALLEHEQAGRAYERERQRLEEYYIRAPFTGYVATHLKQPGETVDQLEGILTLVQLDPLEVVVDCPVTPALLGQTGESVRVRPVDPRWPPRSGKIVLVNRVVDGASQTFKVKLNVPNEERSWLSGLKVIVDFAARGEPNAGLDARDSAVTLSGHPPDNMCTEAGGEDRAAP